MTLLPFKWDGQGLALIGVTVLALNIQVAQTSWASENVPHRPFAEWAELPGEGLFVAGAVYEESDAYHVWASGHRQNITAKANGESYGIDINQGYLALQYGLSKRWAVDLNLGATTVGWRSFDEGKVHSTVGLMDFSFGIRYQLLNEATAGSGWAPTLTFRAGAVLPGTYDRNIAFAPGVRSAAVEPEFLLRKHFGWPGLGAFADALYRWNRTTGNDQFLTSVGFFQQIKAWELDVGYRHLQTLSGGDIVLSPDLSIDYPRAVRENNDAIDAGFSFTTQKKHIRYAFHARTFFDGNNTDSKFWVGGSIDVPFDLPLLKWQQQ